MDTRLPWPGRGRNASFCRLSVLCRCSSGGAPESAAAGAAASAAPAAAAACCAAQATVTRRACCCGGCDKAGQRASKAGGGRKWRWQAAAAASADHQRQVLRHCQHREGAAHLLLCLQAARHRCLAAQPQGPPDGVQPAQLQPAQMRHRACPMAANRHERAWAAAAGWPRVALRARGLWVAASVPDAINRLSRSCGRCGIGERWVFSPSPCGHWRALKRICCPGPCTRVPWIARLQPTSPTRRSSPRRSLQVSPSTMAGPPDKTAIDWSRCAASYVQARPPTLQQRSGAGRLWPLPLSQRPLVLTPLLAVVG